ncbi:flagellar biosynthesis protein FlhG [Desulfobotulus alkaliphilus]|uniref:Flagellar biosynthesis protein FlhG n=1 Tax=Desulfobotulus alkaliphilus TaxID=622671 RepID=A0A562RTH6_9BACT|nr:MinD/ParA family protein [Desulfobotulus alkaliphilus]TWI72399.1 flagellar biosynthesis protein FlhG [Desulfobotulus alkaliphilus]
MDQATSLRKMISRQGAQRRQAVAALSSDQPRVIAVSSGKGGVGKTNLVGNLARAFAGMGKEVLILDADLGLANIDILFGIRPAFHIGHVLNGEKTLNEVMVSPADRIRIIPAGSGTSGLTHLTEGQKLTLLGEFEDANLKADVVLIDTGAGISKNVLYFNLAADECLLVATPEPTSITDAYAMMKVMTAEHGARHFKLVVNMVSSVKEAKQVFLTLNQAAERFLTGAVLEYMGHISMDPMLRRSVQERKTVFTAYPRAECSQQIAKLAKVLVSAPRRHDTEGSIRLFFKRFTALPPA